MHGRAGVFVAVAVLFTAIQVSHVSRVQAADPNYAVELNVPQRASNLEHQYRLVSLAWQDYFANTVQPEVFYTVQSLPLRMNIKHVRMLLDDNTPNKLAVFNEFAKRNYIGYVFEHVLHEYTRNLLKLNKRVRVHQERVDPVGVYVNGNRDFFNRTVVITFENPPYGQSRVNRLVTNRNIPWTVWVNGSTNLIRLNPQYNMTEDLLYRYYHNVGHLLGFGHYIGTKNRDTKQQLPPSRQLRSVMYADYKDLRYSTPIPLYNGVDVNAMSVIHRTWPNLIRDNVVRFNADYLAPALQTLLVAAARNGFAP